MEFDTFTLPNGIRCIHRNNRSKVAHCCLMVNAGSRDELPEELGAAHLTEHTLFKGTTRRKAYQINCRLENLGGELNAFTTKEDTTIHATTLRGDFSKAVELIGDIVFNSTFPDREVEREKEVVIDEINTYRDIPAETIFDGFEAELFAGSSLAGNILGTSRSVRRISPEMLRGFVRRTYTPDQMVFASIGGMSSAAVERTLHKYLDGVEARQRDFVRTAPAPIERFEKSVHKAGVHQAHCILGGRAYSLQDPKRLPLALLINMLGGPAANSMLNILLREHNGLSYTVEASYNPISDSGLSTIYFSSDRDKVERCLELVRGQLRRLCEQKLSTLKLSMAKKQYMGQFAISMENPEGNMMGAAKSMLVFGEVDDSDVIYRKISAVTAEQLMEVANEIFPEFSTLIYH
ncbi:MAG: insulinase family protein [Rikenellaceae bacterium]|nr:insulinase family protein [Rikenellaceae bacterium]